MDGWVGGWVGGWQEGGLKSQCMILGEWVGGWMDGRESRVKDCLQQSKIVNFSVI